MKREQSFKNGRNSLPGILLFLTMLITMLPSSLSAGPEKDARILKKVKTNLNNWQNPLTECDHLGKIKIDSVSVIPDGRKIELYFSKPLSFIPVREGNSRLLYKSVKDALRKKFHSYYIRIFTDGHLLQDLIPNALRKETLDEERFPSGVKDVRIPLVRRSGELLPASGLYNNNIALWSSHGWYYESKLDRWEWQRPRLFGTAEDILTKSITISYLVPMLENSGATVLLPVERDWQPREVIVDNDFSSGGSEMILPGGVPYTTDSPGFQWKDTLFQGDNPFLSGTSLTFQTTGMRRG